ncbi:salicylate 1-monooxygenase [Cupriavidus basilensis OR16]|uniref:Salicylate 1-monooxygenase n=1 Tax=Cupriavidus basilensis OR16 TaxID=1127483 RepID=H1SA54_9BURK|nr:FAD-dependent monooxygenase [Cupriavidus basilensis]EHP40603.1 salicylate 1-monooxygenase [Cupriavidus basilensis OR16]
MASQKIGINGAGIGGLAAAIALRKLGMDVTVFEQAQRFARVGADINLTPNAVRALDGLGVGEALRETAARPTHRISRVWNTGEETSRLAMSDEAEIRYGAPQLTMHRGDLMTALEGALPAANVKLGKKATQIERHDAGATLHFADGTQEDVDVLIGADGIHSAVRSALFGPEHPVFTGVVAYRAVVPAERLAGVPNLQAFTKWWGPEATSQIVTFPLNRGREIFVFATVAQESWRNESWTTPGRVEDVRAAYAGFHAEARALLDACDDVLISALYVRDPLPAWSAGTATLMGDACHPMMPFMAQGAGMAIEDGVVLARCLAEANGNDIPAALARYQAARHARASRVQIGSRSNAWLKEGGNADWVYDYNAWQVPLN